MLKVILLVVAVLVIGVLAWAAGRPGNFRVQRSTVIKAPPENIFALLNDFHRWSGWSPWEKLDPAMKRSFSGADNGPGAVYAWEGNRKVGSGRMEIKQAQPPSRLLVQLDFLRPFEAHNFAEYTLQPQDDGTTVNWTLYGPAPFVSRLMQIFISMDKMVGKDFEAGLANLKALAEK